MCLHQWIKSGTYCCSVFYIFLVLPLSPCFHIINLGDACRLSFNSWNDSCGALGQSLYWVWPAFWWWCEQLQYWFIASSYSNKHRGKLDIGRGTAKDQAIDHDGATLSAFLWSTCVGQSMALRMRMFQVQFIVGQEVIMSLRKY